MIIKCNNLNDTDRLAKIVSSLIFEGFLILANGDLGAGKTRFAKALAKEMRDGLKSVTPFDGRAEGIRKDPCEYCDMYPVCLGDIKTGDNSPE